jgi:UDP:flavonoid glycosyltransferase YjiC (YdhE family)
MKGSARKRYLLAMIDAGATVPPAIGLAAELVRRGHRVQVLCDPIVEPAARSAGCTFSPWRGSALQLAPGADGAARSRRRPQPYWAFRAAKDYAGNELTRRFAQDVVSTAKDTAGNAILSDGLQRSARVNSPLTPPWWSSA